MTISSETRRWMRDASDELAVHNGCWFSEEAGQFVVDWMEKYLRLYEGVWAGRPFTSTDWQYEFHMRLYGWQRPNVEWPELGRNYHRRFRNGIVFIPKKNKKSPTLAANAIYKTHGDGVRGEKMFLCAKDGAQVRQNVAQHIIKMIEASPELMAESKINRNDMTVEHLPTDSKIIPLSSSNVRTEKSKEGLNGSRGVDEVHVVDLSFIRRIDRADISRPEPINLELSTVGDDMDSYGFTRWEYALDVISGAAKDDATLAIVYAAPQDLSDADLAADPVKYGKMANPAWGHTVKESEFLADYERSKKSLRALADFKMYRLNIWQATATPWLNMAHWDLCTGAVDFEGGGPIYCGLDLSSKNDFSAFVGVQQQDDTFAIEGHYWITEERARKHSDNGLPIYDWAEHGWVSICDGARINYAEIESYIEDYCREHDVTSIAHDPWNCEGVRQRLNESGINLVEVPQTMAGLTDACKSLETLVDDKRIAHGNDPVLRWMAKNATVKRDGNDNIKPMKPARETMKAIDGIVALIMAIGEAEADSNGPSMYDEPGALLI